MSKLGVFPHGARVCVCLVTSRVLAEVWLACDVCLHVLGAVAGVVEAFPTSLVVTGVWLLTCVCPHV